MRTKKTYFPCNWCSENADRPPFARRAGLQNIELYSNLLSAMDWPGFRDFETRNKVHVAAVLGIRQRDGPKMEYKLEFQEIKGHHDSADKDTKGRTQANHRSGAARLSLSLNVTADFCRSGFWRPYARLSRHWQASIRLIIMEGPFLVLPGISIAHDCRSSSVFWVGGSKTYALFSVWPFFNLLMCWNAVHKNGLALSRESQEIIAPGDYGFKLYATVTSVYIPYLIVSCSKNLNRADSRYTTSSLQFIHFRATDCRIKLCGARGQGTSTSYATHLIISEGEIDFFDTAYDTSSEQMRAVSFFWSLVKRLLWCIGNDMDISSVLRLWSKHMSLILCSLLIGLWYVFLCSSVVRQPMATSSIAIPMHAISVDWWWWQISYHVARILSPSFGRACWASMLTYVFILSHTIYNN